MMASKEEIEEHQIIESYYQFISRKEFPCVAAREAVKRNQVSCFVAGHMACPKDDIDILDFLYGFIDRYRNETDGYHTAAVIFTQPEVRNEQMFETLMWQRLQSLSDKDALSYSYDKRVDPDTASENFSFSLKEEAMFIIGLHPMSARPTRQFRYATLVFNPHAQFEKMKQSRQYDKLKQIVRKRDLEYSGSVNPMLDDFGNSSEVYQYSGQQYDAEWKCPLQISHGKS